MTYPDEITFEADGAEHVAQVGLPTRRPGPDYMVVVADGVEYQVFINLVGPYHYSARPIEDQAA